ncbi:acyl carrier protein [Butyrivibrio proteoclasticus B316]|uniref:Acyl carrier protein n=1 Tax=Butyrivibrio proteoclasticus (strain ATCC 51982 / DSM 14932 / B316) TaxID=515622 RepID=E0RX17_BUTPB|nr:acyl carrier protein [Butyrivibrio proteoclasticus]ADL34925.1 acyl carrier protein [Butyrivibrio proteoclasticus B316]
MTNYEKYLEAFVECFSVTTEQAIGLKYQDVKEWDSVGHMDLIATLEESFDIMMEMDDVIDFSSFEKGIEIIKKYGVDI